MSHDGDDEIRARAQAALDEVDVSLAGGRHRVREARAYAMHQARVRTIFERRWVTWHHAPARSDDGAAVVPRVAPDPWSFELGAATDGRTSNERHAIASLEVPAACATCAGSLRAECAFCRGEGWKHTTVAAGFEQTGTTTVRTRCPMCDGEGRAACRACDATGRVRSTPVVVVETGTATRTRPVDDGSLPTDLVVAIAEVELAGRVVFAERGAALQPRAAGGTGDPFRGIAPRVSAPVDAAIDALLLEDAVGGDWRARDRHIEVTEVPLYETRLDNGQTAYVCGAPARVLPEGVLEKRAGVLDAVRGLFAHKLRDGE